MGQKVHPSGYRIAVIEPWRSRWYAEKKYAELLHEDLRLRSDLKNKLGHAGVAAIEMREHGGIARQAARVLVTAGDDAHPVGDVVRHMEHAAGV